MGSEVGCGGRSEAAVWAPPDMLPSRPGLALSGGQVSWLHAASWLFSDCPLPQCVPWCRPAPFCLVSATAPFSSGCLSAEGETEAWVPWARERPSGRIQEGPWTEAPPRSSCLRNMGSPAFTLAVLWGRPGLAGVWGRGAQCSRQAAAPLGNEVGAEWIFLGTELRPSVGGRTRPSLARLSPACTAPVSSPSLQQPADCIEMCEAPRGLLNPSHSIC